MVGARSLAMGAEPADRRGLDAAQPAHRDARAAERAAAVGTSSRSAPRRSHVFLVAVWQLDPLVRWLWPIPVAGFVVYPYLKRFTWLCHLWLGAVDGLAPVGALGRDHAATCRGRRGCSAPPSRCWVAGFDLFYSLFDVEVDRAQGLHSWTTRFGVRGRSSARASCTR